MKQTIVEWLEEEYLKLDANFHYSVISYEEFRIKRKELFTKAKAIEKEQIEKAFKQAQECAIKSDGVYFKYESFEQYYNKTFKSE